MITAKEARSITNKKKATSYDRLYARTAKAIKRIASDD